MKVVTPTQLWRCKICGKEIKRHVSRHLKSVHDLSIKDYFQLCPEDFPFCACGCGQRVAVPENKFIHGHHIKVYPPMASLQARKKSRLTCLRKYGTEYCTQNQEVQEKRRLTCLEKYGVEYFTQSSEMQEKSKSTCMKKYGVKCSLQSLKIREKGKRSLLKKYGVENCSQSEKIKQKKEKAALSKFGVKNVFQASEIKIKIKKSFLSRYGVDHPRKDPVTNEKGIRRWQTTLLERYGKASTSAVPGSIEKRKITLRKTLRKRYGVDHPSQIPRVRELRRQQMLGGRAAYLNSFIKNPSKPQLELYENALEIWPTAKLNFPAPLTNYCLDVAVPELKLDLEYDEPYWHQGERKIHDEKRNKMLQSLGWQVIRFQSHVPDIQSLRTLSLNNGEIS